MAAPMGTHSEGDGNGRVTATGHWIDGWRSGGQLQEISALAFFRMAALVMGPSSGDCFGRWRAGRAPDSHGLPLPLCQRPPAPC